MNGNLYDLHAVPLEFFLGMPRLRRKLISQARGRILEVNAGTGFNFRHYASDMDVIALEPDAGMRKKATARARACPRIEVDSADVELLPYPENSFDTVVATFALCSVDDPGVALREIHRVLRPGGRFLSLEHVRIETDLAGRVLDRCTPGWKKLSGGCHLNRRPAKWIAESAFRVEEYRALWGGYGGQWVLKKV